ncbi:MAG: hypothetical protein GX797_00575 [Chloroflexi bacterium]|nr:hypothetical protein [Chloroflexota bacterium]
MNTLSENEINKLIQAVHSSRKYRSLLLPDDLLRNLILVNSSTSKNLAELKTNFRKVLHNVIAPYLEDIDYEQETRQLQKIAPTLVHPESLKAYCLEIMSKHASTKERLPHLEQFFDVIYKTAGSPNSVLDLACALDPLCLPWMNLQPDASFKAYDFNGARIGYLQAFFQIAFPGAQAFRQDILLNPPPERADCAFFFKEAHRMEKRQPGATRILIENTDVHTFILSLPAMDLKGHHSLEATHRHLVEKTLEDTNWQQDIRQVGNELLFFIRKEPTK